ncbi:hypothetical protein, partial [Escherichia coli]
LTVLSELLRGSERRYFHRLLPFLNFLRLLRNIFFTCNLVRYLGSPVDFFSSIILLITAYIYDLANSPLDKLEILRDHYAHEMAYQSHFKHLRMIAVVFFLIK